MTSRGATALAQPAHECFDHEGELPGANRFVSRPAQLRSLLRALRSASRAAAPDSDVDDAAPAARSATDDGVGGKGLVPDRSAELKAEQNPDRQHQNRDGSRDRCSRYRISGNNSAFTTALTCGDERQADLCDQTAQRGWLVLRALQDRVGEQRGADAEKFSTGCGRSCRRQGRPVAAGTGTPAAR